MLHATGSWMVRSKRLHGCVRAVCVVGGLATALGTLAGCSLGLGLAGAALGGPRERLGSLPYPSTFSLWSTAEPDRLGTHISEHIPFAGMQEASRGTVYTCKAGFIDVAHLREAADWTRYAHDEVLAALREGKTSVRFADHFHGEYEVDLAVPAGWAKLTPADRGVEEARAARLAGQRIAYLAMTWHEIATWFGDRTIPFIPEDRSSFTYDDVIAHVVGVRLGGDALALVAVGDAEDFDAAMTTVLDSEMRRLGACSSEETEAAANAVEGRWWKGEQCMKRQVSIGLEEQVVTPWLVPGFGPCAGEPAEPQRLTWEEPATLRRVAGVITDVRMRSPAYSTKLGLPSGAGPAPDRPQNFVYEGGSDPNAAGWLAAKTVMRVAMNVVRNSMRESLGVDFDRP